MGKHALRPKSGRQTYQIAVETREAMMAGTDARVHLTIFGDERDSGKLLLEACAHACTCIQARHARHGRHGRHGRIQRSETNHNPFESGQKDVFTFAELVWLGEISHIRIGLDGGDAWRLDKVLVAEAECGSFFTNIWERIDSGVARGCGRSVGGSDVWKSRKDRFDAILLKVTFR